MKPQDCAKYSTCPKIDSIADRDMLPHQFSEGVYKVCGECKEGITNYVPLEALVEEQEKRRIEWLQAKQRAIDAWIKFMMPKLYREQHELTEEMARLFADMCLKEGRML